jgi:hypothetical protein
MINATEHIITPGPTDGHRQISRHIRRSRARPRAVAGQPGFGHSCGALHEHPLGPHPQIGMCVNVGGWSARTGPMAEHRDPLMHCTAAAGARTRPITLPRAGPRTATSTTHRARFRRRCLNLSCCATLPGGDCQLARSAGGSISATAHWLLLRRSTEWSPSIMGLDYGQHRAIGTTALVCLRGSGSRPQTAGDSARGLISCCLASSVINCRGSSIGWARTHLRLRPAHSADVPRRLTSPSSGKTEGERSPKSPDQPAAVPSRPGRRRALRAIPAALEGRRVEERHPQQSHGLRRPREPS